MRRLISRTAAVASALLLLTAAACGGGGDTQSAEPAEQASSRSPAEQSASPSPESSERQAVTTIETAQSEFGEILVDSEGMTLYMFDPDRGGESTCEGDCLVAWPPVEGPAEAGAEVDGSMLGTTEATDGTTMATYNDWPLYYWVDDKRPGDVTGQAVNDVWWVLGPDGEPIRQMP